MCAVRVWCVVLWCASSEFDLRPELTKSWCTICTGNRKSFVYACFVEKPHRPHLPTIHCYSAVGLLRGRAQGTFHLSKLHQLRQSTDTSSLIDLNSLNWTSGLRSGILDSNTWFVPRGLVECGWLSASGNYILSSMRTSAVASNCNLIVFRHVIFSLTRHIQQTLNFCKTLKWYLHQLSLNVYFSCHSFNSLSARIFRYTSFITYLQH